MDPELYVFPRIQSAPAKITASTAVFIAAFMAAALLLPRLPGPHLWASVDRMLQVGPFSFGLASLASAAIGYTVFIYASYHAWLATRQKNSVEDPTRMAATRLLNTGYYARVRHPMYAMFILADAGLGLAVNSIYCLAFILLTLVLFIANGIFEEKSSLIPQFGDEYRAYMRRVPARYFTPGQAVILFLILVLNFAGLFFR